MQHAGDWHAVLFLTWHFHDITGFCGYYLLFSPYVPWLLLSVPNKQLSYKSPQPCTMKLGVTAWGCKFSTIRLAFLQSYRLYFFTACFAIVMYSVFFFKREDKDLREIQQTDNVYSLKKWCYHKCWCRNLWELVNDLRF